MYPKVGDVDEFYRTVLFPTKARIDLAYYSSRSFRGDIGWLFQGVLATLGVRPAARSDCDALDPKASKTNV